MTTHPEQLTPHGHVLRYTLKERLTHWVAAGSYLYLLATGLAFWSPWLFWLAWVLGGDKFRGCCIHGWALFLWSQSPTCS